jgi:hypothetical protein
MWFVLMIQFFSCVNRIVCVNGWHYSRGPKLSSDWARVHCECGQSVREKASRKRAVYASCVSHPACRKRQASLPRLLQAGPLARALALSNQVKASSMINTAHCICYAGADE